MLMKTKEERSDILDGPTMLMKTHNLVFEATIVMKKRQLSNSVLLSGFA
jgi:predicted RNA-binding protein